MSHVVPLRRAALCDIVTGRLMVEIVDQVNEARATGNIARMAELCVPGIFEGVADLLRARVAIGALDFHETHPAPVRVTLVENADGTATVLHDDDLVGVVDAWSRVPCGQWNVLPDLLGWTDNDPPSGPTWSFVSQINEIRARHARHPFSMAYVSQSIVRAPEPARRAYRVWQRLAGGARDQWTVPVDGEFRWEVVS